MTLLLALGIGGAVMATSVALIATMKREDRNIQLSASSEELRLEIENLLRIPGACFRSLTGVRLPSEKQLQDLVDASGTVIIDVASETSYSNNQFRIDSWDLSQDFIIKNDPSGEREVVLTLLLNLRKVGAMIGNEILRRPIKIFAAYNSSGALSSCRSFSITSNSVWKAASANANDIHNANSGSVGIGVENPVAALHVAGNAYLGGPGEVLLATDADSQASIEGELRVAGGSGGPASTFLRVGGQTTVSGNLSANRFCVGPDWSSAVCRTSFSNRSCPPGQVAVGISEDGSLTCVSVTCPDHHYLQGINQGGTSYCKPVPRSGGCPQGQYISQVNSDGTFVCRAVISNLNLSACPSGHYLRGISNGVANCQALPFANGACEPGKFVSGLDANGRAVCSSQTLSCGSGVLTGIVNGMAVCDSLPIASESTAPTPAPSPPPAGRCICKNSQLFDFAGCGGDQISTFDHILAINDPAVCAARSDTCAPTSKLLLGECSIEPSGPMPSPTPSPAPIPSPVPSPSTGPYTGSTWTATCYIPYDGPADCGCDPEIKLPRYTIPCSVDASGIQVPPSGNVCSGPGGGESVTGVGVCIPN